MARIVYRRLPFRALVNWYSTRRYNPVVHLDNLRLILRKECGLEPTDVVLVGFSGGPDSLTLLHVLESLGQPLVAAHFDHGLRPESGEEAQHAEAVARSLGVPFVAQRGDVAGFAGQEKLSLEEAARILRYQFLFRAADDQRAAAVAVAHNADDQVETVLMHLLRGAGPQGLRGMPYRAKPNAWSESLPLVRPLLAVWRSEIEEYCNANNLRPLLDPSNSDQTFFRNRLRHELVPLMESYVPGFKQRLAQTSALVGEESDLVDELARRVWHGVLSQRGDGFVQLNRRALLHEPRALQAAILRRAMTELRPNQRDVDFDALRRAQRIISDGRAATPTDWAAGLYLLVEGERIWVADWEADLPVDWPQAPEAPTHVEVPFDVDLGRGWRVRAAARERDGVGPVELSDLGARENLAQLDFDVVGEELALRRRRPGDRFQPLGMESGSLKLADFMINEKMPLRARAGWPLLCKGDEIVWVPGYRLAHPYRVADGTKRILEIELVRT